MRVGRRHKKSLAGLAACLTLASLLAYPSSVASVAQPGVTAAANLVALLAARSPGERPTGAAATKQKLIKAPRQRALSATGAEEEPTAGTQTARLLPQMVVPESLPGRDAATGLPVASIDLPPEAAPVQAALAGDQSVPAFGGIGGGSPAGIVFAGAPPGGGGGGIVAPPGGGEVVNPPPGGGGPVITPPVSAVPEPGTWAMMLLGFAMVGLGLRRKRPVRSGAQRRPRVWRTWPERAASFRRQVPQAPRHG